MHFLLTNDDGIGTKGIMALHGAAVKHGHRVTMCAPLKQQSAASHRFTIRSPLFVTPFALEGEGSVGYAIDGTPADCVHLGLYKLVREPVDVVISGINNGYNAGNDTHYSGTVAGAMEGIFCGKRGIAASIHHLATQEMLDAFAEYVIRVAERYAMVGPETGKMLNINCPNLPAERLLGEVYAKLDPGLGHDEYVECFSPHGQQYFWLSSEYLHDEPVEGSDRWHLDRGYITHTIIGDYMSDLEAEWKRMKLI